MVADDPRWPHIGVDILGIVEGHDPAEAVMADIMVEDIVVLVPVLSLATRAIEVAITVGMHRIAGTEQALQGTPYARTIEDRAQLGHARQDVIAGVAFCG